MCKVGVLVHGCHLQVTNDSWRDIVWGKPPDLLGRIPKAVHVAWRDDAVKMIFGTGASSLHGDREGTFTRNYLLNHFDELMQFRIFADNWDLVELQDTLRPFIEDISVVDDVSKNTRQEVRHAAERFLQAGVTDMVLVSSPTHLPRCLRDAYTVLFEPPVRDTFSKLRQNLSATPSDTCFDGYEAGDVEIIEPPHRGDQTQVELHSFVKQLREQFYGFEGDIDQKSELQTTLLAQLEVALDHFGTVKPQD